MRTIAAVWWIQKQPGLKITVGNNRQVTITNGVTVEVTATGLVRAVNTVQKILKQLRDNKEAGISCQ